MRTELDLWTITQVKNALDAAEALLANLYKFDEFHDIFHDPDIEEDTKALFNALTTHLDALPGQFHSLLSQMHRRLPIE